MASPKRNFDYKSLGGRSAKVTKLERKTDSAVAARSATKPTITLLHKGQCQQSYQPLGKSRRTLCRFP
ncbi:hypothetical protein J6590_059934 [Homalodisca vitripennis]|nr:hypothetical protein J6590_059934 [Homalodisca vitripennis]